MAPKASTAPIRGQVWTTSGPLDGPVISLASDPRQRGVIYAGTRGDPVPPVSSPGSLWRSSDGGVSWVKLGSASNQITAIGVDPHVPGRLFAAVRYDFFVAHSSAVYRSTDGGQTWTLLDTGLLSFVNAFAFDPSRPNTVFAASIGGLGKTVDGGDSWSLINTSDFVPGSVVIDPSNPFRLYAGGAGVVRSVNGGQSWENLPIGAVFVRTLAIPATAPSIIYAATDEGAFRSQDGGDTWELLDAGLPAGPVSSAAVDPHDAGRVYVATLSGVFLSQDAGQHWFPFAEGFLGSGPLASDETGRILYVGTGEGVFFRTIRKPIALPSR